MAGENLEPLNDLIDQAVGRFKTGLLSDVEPDAIEIRLGQFRETNAAHRAAVLLRRPSWFLPRRLTRDAKSRREVAL